MFNQFGKDCDIYIILRSELTTSQGFRTLMEDRGYRKRIYFIYPSAELNKIVIRDANNSGNREYVQTIIFAELFEYKTSVETEDI